MILRTAGLIGAIFALGACVPRGAGVEPVAAPPPRPQRPAVQQAPARPIRAPAPAPTAAPAANGAATGAANGWADAPLTPGRWAYRGGAAPAAQYGSAGTPLFTIACPARGQIALRRSGIGGGNSLTFRTSFAPRALAAQVQPDGLTATLPATDPLLDAIAFSRGRFAVEAAGAAQLILPAWPELARVVEDCRR